MEDMITSLNMLNMNVSLIKTRDIDVTALSSFYCNWFFFFGFTCHMVTQNSKTANKIIIKVIAAKNNSFIEHVIHCYVGSL